MPEWNRDERGMRMKLAKSIYFMEENKRRYICDTKSEERMEITQEEYEKLLSDDYTLDRTAEMRLCAAGFLVEEKVAG